MCLAERDLSVRHLRSPCHDEKRVAVLLDLGLLVGVRRVLDRERMQMKLRRDALEQFLAGLVHADLDDVIVLLRPASASSILMSAMRCPPA
jgi:hypothetical protein